MLKGVGFHPLVQKMQAVVSKIVVVHDLRPMHIISDVRVIVYDEVHVDYLISTHL